MSFPRYPKYKDSGVEWLGEVPEHWAVISLGRVTTTKCDGPFGSGLKSEHYTEAGVRVIRLQNIRTDGFDGSDAAFIDTDYYTHELNGHDVLAGDVLIAGLGDDRNTVGRACVAPVGIEPAMVKADCFRFRLDTSRAIPSFVAASLIAGSGFDAGTLSSGSTRSRIPLSVMGTRTIALPTPPEQAAIVSFLDRETAKIDALIAEQQRLIELLLEKRQAVISHAVTKGLNPDARMKDSGIEWLGEVPEHWTPTRLRHLVQKKRRITYGIVQPGQPDDSGTFMVRGKDYSDGWCDPADIFRVSTAIETPYARSRLRTSDIVMTIVGAGVGNVAVVPPWLEGANITQTTARIAVDGEKALPEYVCVALSGIVGQRNLERFVYGSAQPRLNIEHVDSYAMAVPPLEEQEAALQYLTGAHGHYSTLIGNGKKMIALLEERRSALISAAVTGQIDVRGLAESEAA